MSQLHSQPVSRHQIAWEFLRRNPEYIELVGHKCFRGERIADTSLFFNDQLEKIRSFWLRYPVNPTLPCKEFQDFFWHSDYVPVDGLIEPECGFDRPVPGLEREIVTFSLNLNFSTQDVQRLIEKAMKEKNLKKNSGGNIGAQEKKCSQYLLTYDLWFERHKPRKGDLSWPEIKALVKKTLPHCAGDAEEHLDIAQSLITDGYKKFLRAAIFEHIDFFILPNPEYLTGTYVQLASSSR